MGELKKALKKWDSEKENFAGYLSGLTDKSIDKLKEEIERGISRDKPFVLDFRSMVNTAYNRNVLWDMLKSVENEMQNRNVKNLQEIQGYLHKALPIIEKSIKQRELSMLDNCELKVTLDMAVSISNNCRGII